MDVADVASPLEEFVDQVGVPPGLPEDRRVPAVAPARRHLHLLDELLTEAVERLHDIRAHILGPPPVEPADPEIVQQQLLHHAVSVQATELAGLEKVGPVIHVVPVSYTHLKLPTISSA